MTKATSRGARAVSGRWARRANKVARATVRFAKWSTKTWTARHAQRKMDRNAAGFRPVTVTGNMATPNRRPTPAGHTGILGAFLPGRHSTRRWYSRHIHYGADGSITTTPTMAYTWWGRIAAAQFDRARDATIRSAQRRVERDARLGRPRTHADRMERRTALRRERHAGRGHFTCRECAPPLNRFATATEMNEHFRVVHMEDGDAGRSVSEGAPRGMPTSPHRARHRAQGRHRSDGPTMPEPRRQVYLVGATKGADPARVARENNINKIRSAVMANGTGLSSQLAEWGEHVPDGVGAMREDFAELEAIGAAMEEACLSKLANLRQGAGPLNGRPIAESVLAKLERMRGAAQDISRAGTEGLAAFDDEYEADIRRAKEKDRPEDDWLEKGA